MTIKTKPTRLSYGAVKRKVLACLLGHLEDKKALKPIEIARITKLNYNSVKSTLFHLKKQGIVMRTSSGAYIIKNKQKAIQIMEQYNNGLILGRVPRYAGDATLEEWFRRFVDVDAAFFEHARVKFRVDRFVTEKLRAGAVFRPRDRAQQVTYSFRSFSITVSRHGSVRIYIKNPSLWFNDLVEFLKGRGLDEKNIKYFLKQFLNAMPSSRVTVEMPLTSDKVATELRGTVLKTKLNDRTVLVTEICASHYRHGELSITGSLSDVGNFLAALAGSQHFSPLEYLQYEKLNSIDKKFEIIASQLEKLAAALRAASTSKSDFADSKKEKEVESRNGSYFV